MLVLPHAIALSDAEADAVRAFAARGGTVLADAAEPGIFDGRGRRRDAPALAGLPLLRPAVLQDDAAAEDATPRQAFATLLREAGAAPDFSLDGPSVEMRAWRNGAVRLVALQPDAGPEGVPHTAPGMARMALPEPWHLRLLGGAPGTMRAQRATIALDGIQPRILVLSPEPLPRPVLDGPAAARLGEAAAFRLALDGPSPAAAHVLRVELLDPDGAARPDRGWNPVLRGPALDWTLPAAAADRPGRWTVRVTDLLGGARVEQAIEVQR